MPDLKTIIENHPIPILAGVCVVVAGCAAGTVGWFWEKSEALQTRGFEQQLTSVKSEYSDEIADLKQRLISIERQVSGGTLHVDVSKFPITSVEVPSLPSSYESLGDGRYFASPPKFSAWAQQPASQLDLASNILGDGAKILENAPGGLAAIISEKTGTLWQGSEPIAVSLPPSSVFRQSLGINELHLKPFIFVMPVDEALIKRTLKAMGTLMSSNEDSPAAAQESSQEIAKLLDAVAKEKKTAADAGQETTADDKTAAETDKLVDALAGMYRGDIAGFILTDLIMSNFQMALATGGTYKLIAADKKGNVFYMRTHIFFPGEGPGGNGASQAAFLDQEFFFVATPNGGVLIRIGVPSRDLRNDAYAWTQAWLTSLRVSID
jgi:hypothetical protein